MSAKGDQSNMGILIRTVEDFGLVIRERRHRLGLDQRALAARVGVSRKWIVAVEKGKQRAEVGLLLRTLRALDLVLTVADSEARRADEPAEGASAAHIDIDALIDMAKGPRR